jgi:WD40 repeat protein
MSSSNISLVNNSNASRPLLSYPLTNASSFIDYLPKDLVLKIADLLQTAKNINNFGLASRHLCVLLSTPALWDSIARKHFPDSYATLEREADSLAFCKKLANIVRNIKDGKCNFLTLRGHYDGVTSVVLCGDGLISASWDRKIKFWDLKTGQAIKTLGDDFACLKRHPEWIYKGFTRDGQILDRQTGEVLHTIVGHSHWILCIIVCGNKLVSASADHKIKIWDRQTGEELRTLSGHKNTVSTVVACGDKIISGSWDKTIKFWDLETGKELQTINADQCKINNIVVYEDRIFSCAEDSIKIWDFNTGMELQVLSARIDSSVIYDGKLIFSYRNEDGNIPIEIRDLKKQQLMVLNGHSDTVSEMIAYDNMLFSCGYDGIKIWELETGKELLTINGSDEDPITSVAFCGGRLVTGSTGLRDHKIRVWDFNFTQ